MTRTTVPTNGVKYASQPNFHPLKFMVLATKKTPYMHHSNEFRHRRNEMAHERIVDVRVHE